MVLGPGKVAVTRRVSCLHLYHILSSIVEEHEWGGVSNNDENGGEPHPVGKRSRYNHYSVTEITIVITYPGGCYQSLFLQQRRKACRTLFRVRQHKRPWSSGSHTCTQSLHMELLSSRYGHCAYWLFHTDGVCFITENEMFEKNNFFLLYVQNKHNCLYLVFCFQHLQQS